MKNNIINFLFGKIIRKKILSIMRGYRYLKISGNIGNISAIKIILTNQSLEIKKEHFSELIYGHYGIKNAEIITRQYLLYRKGGFNLNKGILCAAGKRESFINYPMPKIWIEVLRRNKFKVARSFINISWSLEIFFYWCYGVYKIIMILCSVKSKFKSNNRNHINKKYIYFEGLQKENLPQKNKKLKNILTWYLQWDGVRKDIYSIRHNVKAVKTELNLGNQKLEYQSAVVPNLCGLGAKSNYLIWGVLASFFSLVDIFRGRWWHAFMLNQAAVMQQVHLTESENIAQEYFFHNSGMMYRPLWTYEAEIFGSKIIFYFYSTNCENFKQNKKEVTVNYGWQLLNWPIYLVWDEWQANFVRKAALKKDAEIIICGPIWFEGEPYDASELSTKGIAVFDVTPHRYSRYCTYGVDIEYYIPDIVNMFCNDLSKVIGDNHYLMLWKKKREIGTLAHPSYRFNTNLILKKKHVLSIPAQISAFDVILSSIGVISLPFTSTALIARDLGKPSIYYDSSGLLDRDDEAAHGIPILQSKEEVSQWITTL